MANTVGSTNYPDSDDTHVSLIETANNASTILNGSLSDSSSTIQVVSTDSFPGSGVISIDNEIISYTSKDSTRFTGCARGFDGTTATVHENEATVQGRLVSAHIKTLQDTIIAMQGMASTSHRGVMSAADKIKLGGIETGATKNATDAQLRNRSLHTGTQAMNTISGLSEALDDKADLSSPNFNGVPTAPTAQPEANNNQIATTAFVKTSVNSPSSHQFVVLGGRSGGQAVYGGTGAGENLDLRSTTATTKGKVTIGSSITFDESSGNIGVGIQNPASGAGIEIASSLSRPRSLLLPKGTTLHNRSIPNPTWGMLFWNTDRHLLMGGSPGGEWIGLSPSHLYTRNDISRTSSTPEDVSSLRLFVGKHTRWIFHYKLTFTQESGTGGLKLYLDFPWAPDQFNASATCFLGNGTAGTSVHSKVLTIPGNSSPFEVPCTGSGTFIVEIKGHIEITLQTESQLKLYWGQLTTDETPLTLLSGALIEGHVRELPY